MPQAVAQQPATPKPAQPAAPPAQAAIPVPTTRDGVDQLRIRVGEIKNQLSELVDRRRELISQQAAEPRLVRSEMSGRIAAIDQRSAMLERELFMTEDAIAQASRRGVTAAGDAGQQQLQDAVEQIGLLQGQSEQDTRDLVQEAAREAVFGSAFGILAMYLVYRGIRRLFGRRKPATGLPDYGPQIAQLQQSIDVIALEVERISEGQRYVAKVLGERGALGPGAAEPVGVVRGEVAEVRAHRP